ncbi:MAG: pyruvate dehydrogenase, partial [Gammaproteobacteria bacterium]|nr:pyruvate dehydrogenase [Gammaproteobacteria bacterium]
MAEPYAIKMPQLSDTMTEGVVVTWEKQVGDTVKRGDIVATVETDKAVMDVEVFRDGYLSGPIAPIDSTVAVGAAIGYIVDAAAEVSSDTAAPSVSAAAPVQHAEKPVAMPAAEAEFVAATPVATAPAGAIHNIIMPQLSDTMTEGVVVTWEKQPGDKIKRGDIVATD